MSISSTSSSTSISQLDSQYQTIIENLMTIESQPLTNLTEKRDTIQVQGGVYNDLKTKIDAFYEAMKALKSSDPFYNMYPGRTVSFSSSYDTASGQAWSGTLATATASRSAVPASYSMVVTSVAKQHRVYSDKVAGVDQDLNLAGTFRLSGAADRSATLGSGISNTLTAASTGSLDGAKQEIGSGAYTVEVRNDADAGWQFRLVDADGKAVSVRLSDGSGYSSDWQAIPTAAEGSTDPVTYDTGRGLTLSFAADQAQYAAGTAQLNYTAKGTTITMADGDTLTDLVEQINSASYAEGMGITATIIDRQLVLTAERTGLAHTINAESQSGDDILATLGIKDGTGFLHTMQTAADAVFSLNNVQITRSSNENLTDVINGVSLTLNRDAEGKTSTLTVNSDITTQKQTINSFISSFNALCSYLKSKTEVTKETDGTYTRKALSGDAMFSGLRTDLLRLVNTAAANSGTLTSFSAIGIELDDDLKLSISDSSKLEKALTSNYDSVKSLMDAVMTKIDQKMSRFSGTKSYTQKMIEINDKEKETIADQISTMEERLAARREFLTNQYAQAQIQITSLLYTQQTLSSIYSSMSTSA